MKKISALNKEARAKYNIMMSSKNMSPHTYANIKVHLQILKNEKYKFNSLIVGAQVMLE